jgi:hypothetical protein
MKTLLFLGLVACSTVVSIYASAQTQWQQQVSCENGNVVIDSGPNGNETAQLVIRNAAAIAYLNQKYVSMQQGATYIPFVNAKGEMIIPIKIGQHWDGSSERIDFATQMFNQGNGSGGQAFLASVNYAYQMKVVLDSNNPWSPEVANWVFNNCSIYHY